MRRLATKHRFWKPTLNASPAAADRVRGHLRARIDRLRANPFIGVTSSNPDIRVLPPTRYPYRIYYSIQSDEIVVLHIRHTARSGLATPQAGRLS